MSGECDVEAEAEEGEHRMLAQAHTLVLLLEVVEVVEAAEAAVEEELPLLQRQQVQRGALQLAEEVEEAR